MLDEDTWISVEEDLPNEIGDYLTFDGRFFSIQPYNSNGWLNMYDALFITHWTFLPKPPKKEL